MFHAYPQKACYETIIAAVGNAGADIELWRECCKFWMGQGYNPKNINGQLARFDEMWHEGRDGASHLEVIDGVTYHVYENGTREIAN